MKDEFYLGLIPIKIGIVALKIIKGASFKSSGFVSVSNVTDLKIVDRIVFNSNIENF